jgi:drug/metabolite transporter, DME family
VRRQPLLGALACATAAVLWASNATVARTAIDRGVEPLELTEVRAFAAFIAFALISAARDSRMTPRESGALAHETPSVPVAVPDRGATVAKVVAFGAAIAIVNLSYFIAIEHLPIAVAIVLQYTAPALVVAYSAIVARTRPSRALVAILALVMVGVALTSDLAGSLSGTTKLSALGVAAALVSAFGFAAYNILAAAVTRSMGALRAHAAGFGVASIIWIAVQAPRGLPRSVMDLSVAPRIAWVAIVGTIVAFGVYAFGIARLGASSASIISTLEPVATAFLGWVVLGQTLDALQSLGALFVLSGVVALSIQVTRR